MTQLVRVTFPRLSLDVSFPRPKPRAVYPSLSPGDNNLLYPSLTLFPGDYLYPIFSVTPSRRVVI